MSVLAIFCADIHLSHNPPVARSAEPDWYKAQARYLNQLGELADKHQVNVYVAGDVFERWDSPVELVNWFAENTIEEMLFAIPGQHDLPHHDLTDIKRSAYWNATVARIVEDMGRDYFFDPPLCVWPFPWGFVPEPLEGAAHNGIQIALAHQYVWVAGKSYLGAPDESHVSKLAKQLEGYDVAVFGDNHKRFQRKVGKCWVYNCGCLIPRSIDERDQRPGVGLLHDNGRITTEYLDTSEDKWIDKEDLPQDPKEPARSKEIEKLLQDLKRLGDSALDFHRAVTRFIEDNKVSGLTKKVLLEAIEDGP
jgi:DNA repair exonuclease SbcCD nuclease subunit